MSALQSQIAGCEVSEGEPRDGLEHAYAILTVLALHIESPGAIGVASPKVLANALDGAALLVALAVREMAK